MRLIFAGTPAFAVSALDALVDSGHEIVCVLTRPDQAAGRGQKLRASPVKARATELGLSIDQPKSLRDPQQWPALQACRADAMIVAAYGLLLPPEVLAIPRLGCLNIHASLLPRWRGAAPIARAIEAGDTQTGITIMQMDAGLDTGPMLLTGQVPIGPHTSAGELHDRLAALGAELIVQALAGVADGRLNSQPQPTAGACYAHRILKQESRVDWTEPAPVLANRMRAFDPWPGMVSGLSDAPRDLIKIWSARAHLEPAVTPPGRIIEASERLLVSCGQGALELLELQRAGGRRLPVREFLKGQSLRAGQSFVSN